jgi:hypothetical protein
MDQELDLVRLDPQWRCFFDGPSGPRVLNLSEDVDAMVEALRRFGALPAEVTRATAGRQHPKADAQWR